MHTTVDFSQSGFVFAPFDTGKSKFLIPAAHSEYMETTLAMSTVAQGLQNFANLKIETELLRKKHIALVSKGMAQIKKVFLKSGSF